MLQHHFGHYTDEALALAVELANACADDAAETPSTAKARAFLERNKLRLPVRGAPLARLHAVRERLRAVLTSTTDAHAMKAINALLDDFATQPRIGDEGGLHLRFECERSDVVGVIAANAAVALAQTFVEHGTSRFGTCAAADCGRIFIDTTKNRSKSFCSERCTNRESIRAFRARARATTASR